MSESKENVIKFEDLMKSQGGKNENENTEDKSNDEQTQLSTDSSEKASVPRGKPKSGRVWKEPKERMPGKSKKFIDKKNSVTFNLVHRSQRDPLITDEKAPQRVLVPVQSSDDKKKLSKEERKEELEKYGIFFDDDYDYLQHLKKSERFQTELVENFSPQNKSSADKTKIVLPSSVFESNVEEEVGLLHRGTATGLRAELLDLDPEVLDTLADDTNFDFDDENNLLEDNFMELGGPVIDGDDDEDYEDEMYEEEMDFDSNCGEEYDDFDSKSFPFSFKDEETKSRFTEYSVSSSVIKRNEQLTLLDDKFEKIFENYDDDEIGALDCEEIEGFEEPTPESNILKQCIEEYEYENKNEIEDISKYIKNHVHIDDLDKEKDSIVFHDESKWDCESILSTYSNIYNHPKLISESKSNKIQIDPRTGIPTKIWVQGSDNKLTAKNLAQLDKEQFEENQFDQRKLPLLNKCHRNETREEKKERKQAVKNAQRERKLERKANIIAFKEEKKRQSKIAINKKNNIQGNCIA